MAGPLDDILGPAAQARVPQPAAPQAAPSGVLDDILGPAQQAAVQPESMLKSLGRQALAGFAAGFDDEAVGLVSPETGAHMRRQKEAFEKSDPIKAGLARAAGTVGSLFVPLGLLGRAGQAGKAVASLLPHGNAAAAVANAAIPLSKTMQLAARVPGGGALARAYGTHAGQGALAATKLGMWNRAGDAGGDTGRGRVGAALDPASVALDAGTGAAGTIAGNWLGRKIGDAVAARRQYTQQAKAEGGLPQIGAVNEVARAMGREGDQNAVAAIRAEIFPTYGAYSSDDIMGAIERYGSHIAAGRNDRVARQRATIEFARKHGLTRRQAQPVVRSIIDRYHERNAFPLQLHEAAAVGTGGEGRATHKLYRVAANMEGADDAVQSRSADWVRGRQETQGGRLRSFFERELGDGDLMAAINENRNRIGASNDLYRPAIDAFNADNAAKARMSDELQNALDMWTMRMAGDQTDIGNELRRVMKFFRRPADLRVPGPGTPTISQLDEITRIAQQYPDDPNAFAAAARQVLDPLADAPRPANAPINALDEMINARRGVRQAREMSKKDRQSTPLTTVLNEFYRDISGVMERASPEWAQINRTRFSAQALKDAYDAGLGINLKAVGGKAAMKMAEGIRDFQGMNPERQAMFRRGIMTQLHGMISKEGGTRDLAKLFNSDLMRERLGMVIGEDVVTELDGIVRRMGIATRTHQATKGSHTAPLLDAKEKMAMMPRLASVIQMLGSPRQILEKTTDAASDHLTRQKMDEMMKLLTPSTDNPAEFVAAIRRIEAAQKAMSPFVATNPGPSIQRGAVYGNLGTDAQLARER
jgi:hypothetical protein